MCPPLPEIPAFFTHSDRFSGQPVPTSSRRRRNAATRGRVARSPGRSKDPTVRVCVTRVWRFAASEEALTATEYAVMLALIVCLCMGPIQTLGCSARQTFTNTSSSMAP